jgi:gliding motility-associated lipoprotein GldH
MNLKSNFLYLIVILLLVSCDKKRVFDEYKTVGNGWNKDSIVSFNLPELDTKINYNLFVNIRNNNKYPYNNLFLIVTLDQPNRQSKVDTLEYQMADEEGNLLGEGFTDVKTSKLFFKENFKFIAGKNTIHIKQAIRHTGKINGVDNLEGITDVGFRIEKTE